MREIQTHENTVKCSGNDLWHWRCSTSIPTSHRKEGLTHDPNVVALAAMNAAEGGESSITEAGAAATSS
jgi:hypothetical protein